MLYSALSMAGAVLAQIDPVPEVALPGEWAAWIIGVLVALLLAFFALCLKIAKMASQKTDNIVADFKVMHTQGMTRLDNLAGNQGEIKDTQIRIEMKNDAFHADIKKEVAEQKYAIQTLNTKVKCQE